MKELLHYVIETAPRSDLQIIAAEIMGTAVLFTLAAAVLLLAS